MRRIKRDRDHWASQVTNLNWPSYRLFALTQGPFGKRPGLDKSKTTERFREGNRRFPPHLAASARYREGGSVRALRFGASRPGEA